MLNESMHRLVRTVSRIRESGYIVQTGSWQQWLWFQMLVPYCCNVPEGKDMSGVCHDISEKWSCQRRLISSIALSKTINSYIRKLEPHLKIETEMKRMLDEGIWFQRTFSRNEREQVKVAEKSWIIFLFCNGIFPGKQSNAAAWGCSCNAPHIWPSSFTHFKFR